MKIDDVDLDHKILDTFGEGIEFDYDLWDDGNHKCITMETEKPRVVWFDVCSYAGLSADGIHYYGKIWVENVKIFDTVDNKSFSMAGYIHDVSDEVRNALENIEVEMTRPITQKDLDMSYGRFEGSWLDEPTIRWNDKKPLILQGKKFFEENFVGNWKFKLNDHTV